MVLLVLPAFQASRKTGKICSGDGGAIPSSSGGMWVMPIIDAFHDCGFDTSLR